jgi:hypothetical protein
MLIEPVHIPGQQAQRAVLLLGFEGSSEVKSKKYANVTETNEQAQGR